MFNNKPRNDKGRINEQIKAHEVRLIDENGKQIGIVEVFNALNMARERGLDLVEIVSTAKPPVAKIMDYGKYQYNKKKQEKKNRTKSHANEVKGIRLGIKTDKHDLEVKQKRAEAFLKKGYKVAVEIRLKGREKMFIDNAKKSLNNFIKRLDAPTTFEQPIKKTPQGFNAVIKNA